MSHSVTARMSVSRMWANSQYKPSLLGMVFLHIDSCVCLVVNYQQLKPLVVDQAHGAPATQHDRLRWLILSLLHGSPCHAGRTGLQCTRQHTVARAGDASLPWGRIAGSPIPPPAGSASRRWAEPRNSPAIRRPHLPSASPTE